MDKETELGEGIRKKKFKRDKIKYMDPDDAAIADDKGTRRSREDLQRIEVGIRAYEAYQKALPHSKISWVCGQCGITEKDNYKLPKYTPLERLGGCRININTEMDKPTK